MKFIRNIIAKIFGIDTYYDIAIDLMQENKKLNDAVFTAYKIGRQAVLDEIKNTAGEEEIEIKDLIELIGEESYETN